MYEQAKLNYNDLKQISGCLVSWEAEPDCKRPHGVYGHATLKAAYFV